MLLSISRGSTFACTTPSVQRSNPHFRVDGEPKAKPIRPRTADAYRICVVEWMNRSQSHTDMAERWSREQSIRAELGSSDLLQELARVFEHKLAALKRMAE